MGEEAFHKDVIELYKRFGSNTNNADLVLNIFRKRNPGQKRSEQVKRKDFFESEIGQTGSALTNAISQGASQLAILAKTVGQGKVTDETGWNDAYKQIRGQLLKTLTDVDEARRSGLLQGVSVFGSPEEYNEVLKSVAGNKEIKLLQQELAYIRDPKNLLKKIKGKKVIPAIATEDVSLSSPMTNQELPLVISNYLDAYERVYETNAERKIIGYTPPEIREWGEIGRLPIYKTPKIVQELDRVKALMQQAGWFEVTSEIPREGEKFGDRVYRNKDGSYWRWERGSNVLYLDFCKVVFGTVKTSAKRA